MSLPKEWRWLIEWAEEQGWKVTPTNGDHLRWEGPHGGLVYSSSTPGGARSFQNHKAHLRQQGLAVPHRPNRKKKSND